MKKFILPLVMIFAFMSCEEEDAMPIIPDPFVGTWSLLNSDIDLEISFDIRQQGDELFFTDTNIKYSDIPETVEYTTEAYDRFAVNTGYEWIKLTGSWTKVCPNGLVCDKWIIINMIHNRIHLKTQDTLRVYTMEIHMMNREMVELQNQVFVRAN